MTNTFKQEFISQQFDYYKQKNQYLYYTSGYHGTRFFHSVNKNSMHLVKETHKNETIGYPYNKKEYFDYLHESHYCPTQIDNDTIQFDFAVEFYKNNPLYQKDFLTLYPEVVGKIETTIYPFIDAVTKSKKEAMSFITGFSGNLWTAAQVDLPEMENYLQNKGATPEEIDKVFLLFFKNRKSQLKNPHTGPKIRDCLLARYNEDKLKPYFSFFPFLADKFQRQELDFYEHDLPFSTVIFINCSKMAKNLLLDNWDIEKYATTVDYAGIAVAKNYGLEEFVSSVIDQKSKTTNLTFLHSNPDFNKQVLKGILNELCIYLKNNEQFEISKDSLNSWGAQYKLQQILPVKLEAGAKRNKI